MKRIEENPFRMLGLLGSASAREINSQKNKLNAFLRAGKEVHSDYDLNYVMGMGKVPRTTEKVQQALSRIEMPDEKILHSIYWFVNGTAFDKVALAKMATGDFSGGARVWETITKGRGVTKSNYSAFSNLGTICLLRGEYKEAVELKVRMIRSDYWGDFQSVVSGNTDSMSADKGVDQFLRNLFEELPERFSDQEKLALVDNCDVDTKDKVRKAIVDPVIARLGMLLAECEKKRLVNGRESLATGRALIQNARPNLKILSNVLSEQDFSLKSAKNSYAKELQACSNAYYESFRDKEDATLLSGMRLLLTEAKSYATDTSLTKSIDSDFEFIKKAEITKTLEPLLADLVAGFDGNPLTADQLAACSAPGLRCLAEIAREYGKESDEYLQVSDLFVNLYLNKLVNAVNSAQENMRGNQVRIQKFMALVPWASEMTGWLKSQKMLPQTRARVEENLKVIQKLDFEIKQARQNMPANTNGCLGMIVFVAISIITLSVL